MLSLNRTFAVPAFGLSLGRSLVWPLLFVQLKFVRSVFICSTFLLSFVCSFGVCLFHFSSFVHSLVRAALVRSFHFCLTTAVNGTEVCRRLTLFWKL